MAAKRNWWLLPSLDRRPRVVKAVTSGPWLAFDWSFMFEDYCCLFSTYHASRVCIVCVINSYDVNLKRENELGLINDLGFIMGLGFLVK